MKKLIILLVAFLMLTFYNATTSQAVTLSFEPDFQDVFVGNQAIVDLVISGLGDGVAPSLSVFDLNIGFNSAILAFDSVTFGSYLGDPDPFSFETSLGFTDDGTGTVNIWEVSSLSALDDIQSSSFTLATLTFDTIALGTSFLNISSVNALGDANANPLTDDLLIISGEINVVSEPVTLFLLGSGLAGLGFLRKRK